MVSLSNLIIFVSESDDTLMTKDQFKFAINGLRMKLPIRVAMYFVLVEGVSMSAAGAAIGREGNYLSKRAQAVRKRFMLKLRDIGYEHAELMLPTKIMDGIQTIEKELAADKLLDDSAIDDLSEIPLVPDINVLENLKRSIDVDELKNKNIMLSAKEKHELITEVVSQTASNNIDGLDGLEPILQLLLARNKVRNQFTGDDIDIDDLVSDD